MKKGYVASVTEYEAGWGQRPDGYILCLDKEAGKAFATKDQGKIWCMEDGSEFSMASDFKLCILTDAGYSAILEKEDSVTWVGNIENFVEEV